MPLAPDYMTPRLSLPEIDVSKLMARWTSVDNFFAAFIEDPDDAEDLRLAMDLRGREYLAAHDDVEGWFLYTDLPFPNIPQVRQLRAGRGGRLYELDGMRAVGCLARGLATRDRLRIVLSAGWRNICHEE